MVGLVKGCGRLVYPETISRSVGCSILAEIKYQILLLKQDGRLFDDKGWQSLIGSLATGFTFLTNYLNDKVLK